MFCIKCGMRLNDSAKSCPACGTKMVFPEGFVPEQSTAVQTETVISNEPPHVPDDFDLSKANISYNGKTMLITDEPEIDLDMTMAAPLPKVSTPVASEPVYQQPTYTPPVYSAPSYAPQAESASEHTEKAYAPKKKSKLPLVIAVAAVALVAILAAVILLLNSPKDKDAEKASSPTLNITENFIGNQPSKEDESKPASDNPGKPDASDSACETVKTLAFVTHYVVINPNAADYNEIKQRIETLKKDGLFEQIFEASFDEDLNYVNSFDSELICCLPSVTNSPFANAGGLILSEKTGAEIHFEQLATQNDAIDFVANSNQGCIAFVSYDSEAELNYPNVELISIYTDEIVLACEIGKTDDIVISNANIGICSDSAAYRYVSTEKSYIGMEFSEKQILEFDTEDEMIEALENGKIDCIITDKNHAERISFSKSESIAEDLELNSELGEASDN